MNAMTMSINVFGHDLVPVTSRYFFKRSLYFPQFVYLKIVYKSFFRIFKKLESIFFSEFLENPDFFLRYHIMLWRDTYIWVLLFIQIQTKCLLCRIKLSTTE